MLIETPYRLIARVEIHLPGNFTRVVLPEFGNGSVDIPTDAIPFHLRGLGSSFIVVWPRFKPEPSDSIDAIREMCRRVQVEERV
jgi:hypothetical protein